MAKLPNQDLHGAELTAGTIMVMSFTTIVLGVCIFIGIKLDTVIPFFIGPAFFLIGTLLCLPNIINWVKGKIKEHRIRTGKEQPVQKKSWDPKHRFDD